MIRVQITVDHGHGVVDIDERLEIGTQPTEEGVTRAIDAAVLRAATRAKCAVVAKEAT